jgi:pyruvate dehydrogenase (quinone)
MTSSARTDRSWREEIESAVREWWKVLEGARHARGRPAQPAARLLGALAALPDNCIITCDSGSAANWYARYLKMTEGMMARSPATLATMGPGVPYAIAAKFAHPDRPVIACVGDGAMQMNGMNELITIEKYWKEWSDPRLIVLVLNNRDLNQVTWEMRAMEGIPKFEESQTMPDFDYARFAELCGLRASRMERPTTWPAWERALPRTGRWSSTPRRPEVPPLPPHISFEQTTAMLKSLIKGDPEARDVIKQSFKGKPGLRRGAGGGVALANGLNECRGSRQRRRGRARRGRR